MTAQGSGKLWWMIIILIVWAAGTHLAVAAEEVPRITKEELKSMLGNPDLIILDVRTPADWEMSQTKIKGAVREDPGRATKSWAEKYGKAKTITLYCA
jgi:rhodanese-related sulfurtransferase